MPEINEMGVFCWPWTNVRDFTARVWQKAHCGTGVETKTVWDTAAAVSGKVRCCNNLQFRREFAATPNQEG